MTGLFVAALLVLAGTIWLLAWPLRANARRPTEDREALIQLRDRLLGQLREIDVEAGDRNIDPAVAAEERRRLEAELAAVLKSLENIKGAAAEAPGTAPRRLWLVTLIVLAVA